MTLPTTIRTQVSQDALTKVTRLFNGTADDVLNELLQNARRAGATRVDIETLQMMDGQRVLKLRDDGRGIGDPSVLLTLGQSGWDDNLRRREDPAGMGVFSLAGKRVQVQSFTPETGGWRIVVPAKAWESGSAISVEVSTIDHGTEIAIDMPEAWAEGIAAAAERAALHYPLPVAFDGALLARSDFLADAVYIEAWNGCRIGVFKGRSSPHSSDRRVNFHGLTVMRSMPHVAEIGAANCWTVRVDIVDAPGLELVLPARKELVSNEALAALDVACRRAIYRAIARQAEHRLSFNHWGEARDLGVSLPEAAPWLDAWSPSSADYRQGRPGDGIARDKPMLIVPDEEADVEQSAAPALVDREVLGARAVCEEPAFRGYGWYDALPRVVALRFSFERDGVAVLVDRETVEPQVDTGKVSRLRLEATIVPSDLPEAEGQDVRVYHAPLDVLVRSTDCYSIDDALIFIDKTASIDPDGLANLLEACLFDPSDDRDCDSWYTQRARFLQDAQFLATHLLLGEAAALRDQIIGALAEDIAWLVPPGQSLTATITGRDINVKIVAVPQTTG